MRDREAALQSQCHGAKGCEALYRSRERKAAKWPVEPIEYQNLGLNAYDPLRHRAHCTANVIKTSNSVE